MNATDEFNLTPLHIAGVANRHAIAEILLQAGANPRKRSYRGRTAMDYVDFKVLGTNVTKFLRPLNAKIIPKSRFD